MKLVFLLFFLPTALFAQAGELTADQRATLSGAEDDLLELSYRMHTDSSAQARFTACESLIKELVQTLKTPNSYRYDFPHLKGVKIVTAPDNKFRIFSWELHVDRDTYRHYGAIQYNSESLRLQPLIDRGATHRQNPETVVTTNRDWLGYVAYDILPGGVYDNKPYYFVFGYDRYAATIRQKFVDVLHFAPDGTPTFGLPVFVTYTPEGHLLEDRTRLLLEFNAEATAALRFEPETGRLMYENLILVPDAQGQPVRVPDGSYHALEAGKDGRWHEVSKVFSHVYEKAPRPVPLAEDRDDIKGGGGR